MEDFSNPMISTHDLPDAHALEYTPLHPRLKQMLLWSNLLLVIVILLAGGIALLTFAEEYRSVAIFFCVLAGVASLLLILYILFFIPRVYRHRGYAVREHDITYRHGAIFRKVSTIPYRKVQQVEVVQGLAGKICNLHGLQIITGAQTNSGITIVGLPYEDADKLRSFIIDKANERR